MTQEKTQQYLTPQAMLQQNGSSFHQLQCFCLTKLKSIIICTAEILTDLVLKAKSASLTSPLMVQLSPNCHGSAVPACPAGLDQVQIKWCHFSIKSREEFTSSPKELNWKGLAAPQRLSTLPGFEVKSQQERWKLLWLAKLSAKSWLATGERLGGRI